MENDETNLQTLSVWRFRILESTTNKCTRLVFSSLFLYFSLSQMKSPLSNWSLFSGLVLHHFSNTLTASHLGVKERTPSQSSITWSFSSKGGGGKQSSTVVVIIVMVHNKRQIKMYKHVINKFENFIARPLDPFCHLQLQSVNICR